MIRFLIGTLVWLFFIKYEVWRNYTLIEVEKERPNYLASAGIRTFLGAVCLAIMFPDLNIEQWNGWLAAWPYVVFEISTFYLLFDPWLNNKRGLEWNYRGQHSGWFFDRIHLVGYYTMKVLCLIGFLYTSILILCSF
jgi:hypothetical protein